ncbi:hypothetical protein PCASD_04638 [Puccinia coronata f. sp. avenae]|uniref:Uncharacterized protein n=1 Tax=Puccinia coronata f. sp. avenae TaxID=200324 RepID=A0A2N5UXK3_9BASI|nr:hypothetical protein PCASD_04638 [Puccinia coronata f. sp. avenae]
MKLSSLFLTLTVCHGLYQMASATPVPKKHHGHRGTEHHPKKKHHHHHRPLGTVSVAAKETLSTDLAGSFITWEATFQER